jgi:choline dehydrogenase-like flavoprotein
MGTDPGVSVVDRWGKCWGTRNLFVVDGAIFPSAGYQNHTLTIMALASRTCAHILEAGALNPG